jgi:lipopolysaccharide heptosyltransferase I
VERERILLVRLSALGDVVQCLPALAALRRARPEAEIGWLVEDRHAGALEGHPQIDRLFRFERRSGGLSAAWRVRGEVGAWAPHVAVDLQGNLKGGLLTRLSGARRRIGLPRGEAREGAQAFANEIVPPGPPGEHRADRALRLCAPLGAQGPAAPVLPPIRSEASTAMAAALAALGASPRRYALLVPGTSEFGAFKRWPARRFGELAERLVDERGLASLVAYGPGQRGLAEDVVAAAAGAARLAPDTKDLHEFLALVADAALVVGADSGPVVLASALGVPTVALFGPKDPAVYAPRGPRTAVVWKRVYCSPCRLRQCGDPICMTTMETAEAWEGVRRLGALA